MNVAASVEPGASAATWRSVAAVASRLRYMMTPVEATTAGWPAVEAGALELLPPGPAALEVDGHEPQPLRDAVAELDQTLALPGLRPRPIDLEYAQPRGDLRPALREGVEAGAEDDVLADAAARPLDDQILDEARAGHDGGAGPARAGRVHVRTAAPAVARRQEPQADLVLEHVRRRIDLCVQGPPQGDPHRRAVRRRAGQRNRAPGFHSVTTWRWTPR